MWFSMFNGNSQYSDTFLKMDPPNFTLSLTNISEYFHLKGHESHVCDSCPASLLISPSVEAFFHHSCTVVESSRYVMAHGDAGRRIEVGYNRTEWVTSQRHMTAEHRFARAVETPHADIHNSAASSRMNWLPRRFKWSRPFRRKTKSAFCACAITFQTQSNQWRTEGGCGGSNISPPPEFRSFDKFEPDCKLSGKCLVFLFQHPN